MVEEMVGGCSRGKVAVVEVGPVVDVDEAY